MSSQFADIFIAANAQNLPSERIYLIKEKLENLPKDKKPWCSLLK